MFSFAAIGSTIANSRTAQYFVGGALIVIGFLVWLARHDAAIRRNHDIRREREARKKDAQILENSNEAVQAADTIRANVDRARVTGMPERPLRDYNFRD